MGCGIPQRLPRYPVGLFRGRILVGPAWTNRISCPETYGEDDETFTPLFFVVLLTVADQSVAQPKVEAKGITSKVKLEEVIYGHLVELNGKFKLRVTEVTLLRRQT
jgi:hypothetical protein